MPTTTTNYSFQKPVVGADEDAWGGYINNNFDSLDSLLSGTTALTSLNITGDFTVDTDTLHVDSTNNRVGIGTTSPLTPVSAYGTNVAKYSLQSSSGVGGGFIAWYDNTGTRQQYIGTGSNTDSEFRIYQEANDDMVFATNSAARMRITAAGDVGIGTSSPAQMLHLAKTGIAGMRIEDLDAVGGYTDLRQNGNAFFIDAYDEDGTEGVVVFRAASTETMRINESGSVGIGTSTPSDELHVVGDIRANAGLKFGTTSSYLYESAADKVALRVGTDGPYAEFIDAGSNVLEFGNISGALDLTSNGTARARIDTSGNLLVGTTDTTLYNNTTGTGALIKSGNVQIANSDADCLRLNRMTSTGQIAYFYQAGTNVGNISVTGSATAYNTSSDYRLKEDWQPMTGACDRVLTLKPVNFAWKVDGSRVDGFLAHELSDVVPEAVTGHKDEVDDEGNPVYQGIDQSKLVPLLTAALQEALTKIDALETRIAALEG